MDREVIPTPLARSLKKGEVLFREGDRSRSAFLVVSGSFKVYRLINCKKVAVAQIGARQIIGEMAFLGDTPRSATVEAMEDCEIVEIEIEKFEGYLQSQPQWLQIMIQSLIGHVKAMNDRVVF